MKLEKTYNAKKYEQKIYESWEKGGFFKPEINPKGKPFGVVIPPPNITGELHLGHALCNTIKDIVLRYRRMNGEKVLYVPGTDHAGIATQTVIEKELKEEGKTRHDLGREKFVKQVWEWKEKYGNQITDQLKRLGTSCDWDREKFTLSPELNKAVNKVFVQLYKDDLIYRGNYLVNWCTRCGTAVSDLEVDYKDVKGKLWELKYPFKDNPDKFVTVATTRPETMLGDTAVAVNPKDKRYKDLIGKTLILPLMNREIPIIADELVDQKFGTGVVKVTPAHDPNDYEMGKKHKLDFVKVIGENGKMTKEAGDYSEITTQEAREKVLADLKKQKLLGKEKDYLHSVGHCQRCGEVIEPLTSKQWFVKMESLAKPAIEVIKKGEIKVQPKRFEKIYFDWLENIRDWCISRQLWWGHQIPVYYCAECDSKKENPIVSEEKVEECPKCNSKKIEQDPDVLDTWFSSALWPFSALGWPKETDDFKTYYPNDLMENGRDIIFFWDARMIMMGLYFTKKIPFKHLYLHGMVLDRKGRKMSKSLGNGIDPIKMIDKYGADALRMALVVGLKPGNDMRMYEEKIKGYRNFSNKLWNISRFVLDRTAKNDDGKITSDNLADKWILSRLQNVIKNVTEYLEKYQLSEAGQELYEFIWSDFADWYLEISKVKCQTSNVENKNAILVHVLENILKLAHPFMPFVTEAIWPELGQKKKLIISDWPKADQKLIDAKSENSFAIIRDLIIAIRNTRAESKIDPGKPIEILIDPAKYQDLLSAEEKIIQKLARVGKIEYGKIKKNQKSIPCAEGISFTISGKAIDQKVLVKEKESLEKYINTVKKKLENNNFIKNAPKEIVIQEKKKLKDAEEKLKRL
ncbi:valine--tRNA ligase [Patescibacteria group bacterium]